MLTFFIYVIRYRFPLESPNLEEIGYGEYWKVEVGKKHTQMEDFTRGSE
jgi:hypothetical protein